MKLTVLCDNNTIIDQYYLGEPALSFYIEDGDKKILFDTGYSGVFLKNADLLNINLYQPMDIVLSHGHNDHTRGLNWLRQYEMLQNKRIIAHPDIFNHKYVDSLMIGSEMSKEELETYCSLTLSKTPVKLSDKLMYLGEIPQHFDFEPRLPIGMTKHGKNLIPNLLYDDSAMVYHSMEGLFIITGCSHSGICNIIETAKQLCNEERILGVIGGFHLFEVDERLNKTIDYLKACNCSMLYPCHCVSFKAKAEMNQSLPITEIGSGISIEII